MAERVFCIDFGSAYTKVALRRDPGAESQLLSARVGTTAELDFCIPTTVAVDRRGPKPIAEFGAKAADMVPGGGIEVYRNWKKAILQPPAESGPHQSPLESLLDSDEFAQLAIKFELPSGQVNHLRQLVAAAKHLIVGPGGRVTSSEAQEHRIAMTLAPHFFIWLRQQVLEACNRLPATGLKYEAIPTRITVPAFEHGKADDHGRTHLLEALGKAGWPLHPENPTVPEPYSNAIGVLTKGANVFHHGHLRLGDMFGRSPLITVLKDASHHPTYRALVVDVGAYTTDFAILSLSPADDSTSDPDAAITVSQHSVPLGVTDLDLRMIAALPAEKGEWLRKASAMDWEDFRPAVYTEGKGVHRRELPVIGGPGDAEAVRGCVGEFANQLASETVKFLASVEPVAHGSLEELILTGGGSFIPQVRDAIRAAAQSDGREFVKTHAPALRKTAGEPPVNKLDPRITRGGSALGGASIYFEKGMY